MRPLRILAADDSAVMRRMLRTVFEQHAADRDSTLPPMELCGLVSNGEEALGAVEQLRPDLLLLDLEMPLLGGLGVLDRLRLRQPGLPVIMCSAHTKRGALATLDAFRRGANDYVMKPSQQTDLAAALVELGGELLPKIAALAAPCHAPAQPLSGGAGARRSDASKHRGPKPELSLIPVAGEPRIDLVVIGVSTGGPSALEVLLPMLPVALPVPVMIVQHMPKLFTTMLAERLDKLCRMPVQEARDGARLHAGTILLAPGDAHMEVSALAYGAPGRAQVKLHHGPALNSCKPAVDYLFQSAARLYGAGTLAVVLTGMGSDGLEGARAVQQARGTVLAQDEATSAVWGMPGRVSRDGIATATLPLCAMATAIVQRVQQGRGVRSAPPATNAAAPPATNAAAPPATNAAAPPATNAAAPREVRYGLL